MDKIIIERINRISVEDLDSMQFYRSKLKLEYKDIINVWKDYLYKRYLNIKKIVDFDSSKTNSILKISLHELTLSILLEELFVTQINEFKDNLILIYLKNSDKILIFYKSFTPLLNDSEIKLPYWNFLIESKKFSNNISELFKNEENICLMSYLIN